MKYLLDSVIVIDHLSGIKAATEFLASHAKTCSISVITYAEVLAGVSTETSEPVIELLSLFPALPITLDIADSAARLRRSERWKLPDALQAAVAMHHGLTLVTRNTKDFHDGATLRVVVPYRV